MPGHVPGLRASAEMEEGEVNEMNTKKMAIVGTGLVVAGVGLGAIGAALLLPAVVALTAGMVEKASGRLADQVERASRRVGTVAGTLQKSFVDAAQSGVTEIRREKTM